MFRVFDRISAEFSPSFQENYNAFLDNNNALFQRICDATGVVLVRDQFSKKLLGPWDSIRYAHDLLTGYVLFQSFTESSDRTEGMLQEDESQPLPTNEMQDLSLDLCPRNTLEKEIDDTQDQEDVQECDESLVSYDGRFHCSECKYSGLRKQNLRDHVHRMHNRPFRCRSCLRGFGYWRDLRRHQKYKKDSASLSCHHRGRPQKCGLTVHKGHRRRRHFGSYVHTSEEFDTLVNNLELSTDVHITAPVDNMLDSKEAIVPLSTTSNADESNSGNTSRSVNFTNEEMGNINQLEVVVKQEVVSDDELHDAVNYMQIQQQNKNQITSELTEKVIFATEKSASPLAHSPSPTPSSTETSHTASATSSSHIPSVVDVVPFTSFIHPTIISSPSKDESIGIDSYTKSVNELTGETRFLCKQCCYTVDRKHLIEDHIKRIHIRQFQCDMCGATFGLLKDLNRHYRKTHKIMIKAQRRGRHAHNSLPLAFHHQEQDQHFGS